METPLSEDDRNHDRGDCGDRIEERYPDTCGDSRGPEECDRQTLGLILQRAEDRCQHAVGQSVHDLDELTGLRAGPDVETDFAR